MRNIKYKSWQMLTNVFFIHLYENTINTSLWWLFAFFFPEKWTELFLFVHSNKEITYIYIISSDLNIEAYGYMKENTPICAYFSGCLGYSDSITLERELIYRILSILMQLFNLYNGT